MPEHIPKVQEIGATSAPLTSAAYYIGDRCKAFSDDYMKCKDEANGRGEIECLKEGRKVTRCAASVYVSPLLYLKCCRQWNAEETKVERGSKTGRERVESRLLTYCSIKDINTHCLEQFKSHWECLENNNHQLWDCRRDEMALSKCVFNNLV